MMTMRVLVESSSFLNEYLPNNKQDELAKDFLKCDIPKASLLRYYEREKVKYENFGMTKFLCIFAMYQKLARGFMLRNILWM
jgi:hypothetical protein